MCDLRHLYHYLLYCCGQILVAYEAREHGYTQRLAAGKMTSLGYFVMSGVRTHNQQFGALQFRQRSLRLRAAFFLYLRAFVKDKKLNTDRLVIAVN